VSITPVKRDSVANANAKYLRRLEEGRAETTLKERWKEMMGETERTEKLKKLSEEWRRKIHEKEKEVKKTEQELKEELTKATNIFWEANNRLTHRIRNKDFAELNIAEGLLEIQGFFSL
jgi:chromatin segregation and condensation protein Rec8/ScpA/Scc1 (kleisin family)